MKPCVDCGVPKELTEYYTEKKSPDGRRSDCKECFRAARRQRHAVNKIRDRGLIDQNDVAEIRAAAKVIESPGSFKPASGLRLQAIADRLEKAYGLAV